MALFGAAMKTQVEGREVGEGEPPHRHSGNETLAGWRCLLGEGGVSESPDGVLSNVLINYLRRFVTCASVISQDIISRPDDDKLVALVGWVGK